MCRLTSRSILSYEVSLTHPKALDPKTGRIEVKFDAKVFRLSLMVSKEQAGALHTCNRGKSAPWFSKPGIFSGDKFFPFSAFHGNIPLFHVFPDGCPAETRLPGGLSLVPSRLIKDGKQPLTIQGASPGFRRRYSPPRL